MVTKSKMRPATSINSNAWYHVTEGRVDRAGRKFGSMLQVDNSTNGLKVFPITKPPYYWQFQSVNSSSSSLYVVRNSLDGASKQLSACRNETEPADGQTGLCMAPANGADAAQIWQLDQWGNDMARDGLRFINAANGTKFWLDVHRGNPPFMNNSVEEDGDRGEPAQRWYMTSAQAVNAIEYSTIQTIAPTGTEGTAATASTTADSEATTSASNSSSSNSTSGLSTGAQAGIGVGVVLAIIALGIAALFLWRHRKAQNSSSSTITSSAPDSPNTNKPLPFLNNEKKLSPLPSELPDGSHHSAPQELPASTARLSSSQIAHEAQAQRYELDSTPVSR